MKNYILSWLRRSVLNSNKMISFEESSKFFGGVITRVENLFIVKINISPVLSLFFQKYAVLIILRTVYVGIIWYKGNKTSRLDLGRFNLSEYQEAF